MSYLVGIDIGGTFTDCAIVGCCRFAVPWSMNIEALPKKMIGGR